MTELRAGRRRQAGRDDLPRRRGPGPPAGRHPQGRPRRHPRPDGHRRAGARRRARHPAARPPDAHRQGVRRHGAARRGHHDRRRRGRGRLDRLDRAASTRRRCAAALGRVRRRAVQVPTAVSAIKVDGKRAYQRVRAGEEVELEPRPVTVHELVVHDVRPRRRRRRRRRLAALLQRHLRPRHRPRPRRRARRRRPPDRAAAYGRRALRPRRRPHPRRSSPTASRCCRSPTPRARRSRPSTSTRRRPRDVRVGRPLDLALAGLTRGVRTRRGVPGALRAPRRAGPSGGGLRRVTPSSAVS